MALKRLRDAFDHAMGHIDRFTRSIRQRATDHQIRVIQGDDAIAAFVNQIIDQVRHHLALSVWAQDLPLFQNTIDSFLHRNGHLTGIYFGHTSPYPQLTVHRRTRRVLAERRARCLVAAIDYDQTISGVIDRGVESQVTWTRDKGFVEMSEDYIVHDISLNEFLRQMDSDARKKHETFLDGVRKDYFSGI